VKTTLKFGPAGAFFSFVPRRPAAGHRSLTPREWPRLGTRVSQPGAWGCVYFIGFRSPLFSEIAGLIHAHIGPRRLFSTYALRPPDDREPNFSLERPEPFRKAVDVAVRSVIKMRNAR
jgi:hypothetical protein